MKNNVLSLTKQFAIDYQNVLDWNETGPLQNEEFITQTTYDALNRPITITQPDNTVASYVYNKGGLLEQVMHDTTTYISNINYNEKGQRSEVYYGNNTKTKSVYDAKTFRLKRLLTTRNNGVDIMQDLNYTFDAVGNIVQQNDNAQQTHYYSNQVIAPNCTYTYDPLYRLINATGRELTSLAMPTSDDFTDNIGVPNPAANVMQNYHHTYVFDELGNMQSDNWKDYVYDTTTNRLLKHDPDQTLDDYTYDVHGNMLTMPHLTSMVWDFADRLQSAGNGTFNSYYNYDMGGNRSRKVVIKNNNREERYYMGDYEIYRKYINDELDTERSTVHIIDDRDRFAMIETETGNTPVVRYQYNNHLGSACLELDEFAEIISYEEYHPFGTTSYRSGSTETEVSLKRYKYIGKERDEETGLYYYGARYYAAWLCRFVSVDPLQFKYPHYTPFQYAGNRPIIAIDIDGLEPFMPDSAMAPKTQPDNYVCSDNSDIQVPYRPNDKTQNTDNTEIITKNYWKYNEATKKFDSIGSNTNAPFNKNNQNYIMIKSGTVDLVTPENADEVQSQFVLFPAKKTVDLMKEQYDEMKDKKSSRYHAFKNIAGYRYKGTFYEKGGFQVSKGTEIKAVPCVDGDEVIPTTLTGASLTIYPTKAAKPEDDLGILINEQHFSRPEIIWHFHASATLINDTNTTSFGGVQPNDQLWLQVPSTLDKNTAKTAYVSTTRIQFSTEDSGSANFYNSGMTYLSIPNKALFNFYNQ